MNCSSSIMSGVFLLSYFVIRWCRNFTLLPLQRNTFVTYLWPNPPPTTSACVFLTRSFTPTLIFSSKHNILRSLSRTAANGIRISFTTTASQPVRFLLRLFCSHPVWSASHATFMFLPSTRICWKSPLNWSRSTIKRLVVLYGSVIVMSPIVRNYCDVYSK